MSEFNLSGNSTRLRRKIIPDEPESDRKQKNISIKKVSVILKKREEERTVEENEFLFQSSELAKEAASRLEKRELLKQREKEFEDSDESLDEKCSQLAEALGAAKYLVVYTGAGISTAAQIPDYRGTSGIWTLLQQGKDIGEHDLTQAEPTYTHMALSEMYHRGRLKHIVSQNCDGLHLRSGLPKTALSELHGNMYIEVCRTCRPFREYLRLFDVTESTARFSHRTQRLCYGCQSPLADSIVHFGERGNLPWPLNWKGACRAAEKADVILCMGSSLKVMKRYPWLWSMDKPAKRRPKLFIVNLQWTPKDCHAALKIHGKCDDVMMRVMKFLAVQVPAYRKESDPIFCHATLLCTDEHHTTTRRSLDPPPDPPPESPHRPSESPDPPPDSPDPPPESAVRPPESPDRPASEELILITVKSDPPVCCDNYRTNSDHDRSNAEQDEESRTSADHARTIAEDARTNADHDRSCPNFVEEDRDVPIIMAPDLQAPLSSLMEVMFFNYLYTLISSLAPYPLPTAPIEPALPSTSSSTDEDMPEEKKMKMTNPMPKCSFCTKQYSAEQCLFYVKYEGKFEGEGRTCLCCGEEESEGEEEGEEKKEEGESEKGEEKQKMTSNPGWYGRGCRKRVKKKR